VRVLLCPLYHHIRVCFRIQLPYEIDQVVCFISSHTVFLFPFATYDGIPSRDLLILDEVHRLEEEIVKFTISISKRRWKRYIPDLKIVD
jgi:hypothetical protein